MGKVEDVGGVVTQGVGVGKKFSAAFGGQKFTPMGMGPGEGGSKKILWPGGCFTNKSWSIFFYWGGDFGKNGFPGGVKKFSAAFGGQKFTTPLGPGSNVVRGVVRQNFRLKGGGPTPHHPPLAHVCEATWGYMIYMKLHEV